MAVDSATRARTTARSACCKLPRNTDTSRARQVQNNFEANREVAQQLTLLRSRVPTVDYGNLLSLPVGGRRCCYVEPVYVRRSTGSASYPLLQKVLVAFGETSAFQDTLDEALAEAVHRRPSRPGTGRHRRRAERRQPRHVRTTRRLTQALDDADAGAWPTPQAALSRATSRPTARRRTAEGRDRTAVAAQPSTPTPGSAVVHQPVQTAPRPFAAPRRRPARPLDGARELICPARVRSPTVVATDAGWSSSVARWAHNPEVAGSNPAPATNVSAGQRLDHRSWWSCLWSSCHPTVTRTRRHAAVRAGMDRDGRRGSPIAPTRSFP